MFDVLLVCIAWLCVFHGHRGFAQGLAWFCSNFNGDDHQSSGRLIKRTLGKRLEAAACEATMRSMPPLGLGWRWPYFGGVSLRGFFGACGHLGRAWKIRTKNEHIAEKRLRVYASTNANCTCRKTSTCLRFLQTSCVRCRSWTRRNTHNAYC